MLDVCQGIPCCLMLRDAEVQWNTKLSQIRMLAGKLNAGKCSVRVT